MKHKIIVLLGAVLCLTAGFRYALVQKGNPGIINAAIAEKKKFAISCTPDWNSINADSLATTISVLPGWGNYRWHITTNNDSAQFYFNQGINLYYAFHIIESMASFKKAQLFDANNAMIYWAQALAYGPNINDFEYSAAPAAYDAAQKAVALSGPCNAKEKALIRAMAVRYSNDSSLSRAALNQKYTDAMQQVYKKFASDADAGTLYADAMMLQHPWEYWKHNGEAHPWTPAIINVLEKTLALHPNQPGANHYYIHMVEASPNPSRALASAGRLGRLMPEVSHMIHMPSHIYIRTGNYIEGMKVNRMSVNGYNKYLGLYKDVEGNAFLYLMHNLHMQSACALFGADYTTAKKSAEACAASFDTSFLSLPQPLGNAVQYLYMTPVFADVRFGKWDAILTATDIPEQYVYARVLQHWARGMAYAAKMQMPDAVNALQLMQEKMKTPDLQVVMEPFNAPYAAAIVAEKILEGIIAAKKGQKDEAITLLQTAANNETALIYTEPRDWLLPARQYLGAVLLRTGNGAAAEKSFREDLRDNPGNHWSLWGLYQSLLLQKKTEAAQVKKQYDKAFAEAKTTGSSILY
jgi:tetratricopeptide (TPR) repeat protein